VSNWKIREKSSQLLILWTILTDSGQKIVQAAEISLEERSLLQTEENNGMLMTT